MSKAIRLLTERLAAAEERAARLLAQARQDQMRHEQQLEAINQYRETYSQQMLERGVTGLTGSQFGHYQAFINKLDGAARQQQDGVLRIRQAAESKRLEWLELQQQRKAMETLLERKAAKEALRQARLEQKMLDEFATFRHFHRAQD